MKRLFSAGLVAALALGISGCMRGGLLESERAVVDESRPLAADGRFSLENTNGRVEVRAWDEARVRIEATKRASSQRALEELRVEVASEGDHVRVRTHSPRARWLGGAGGVDYVVHVPRTARVSVENVNGRVEVSGVAAAVTASTVNGSVEVADARGAVQAKAVNGSVEASLAEVDPSGHSRLRTTNGSVRLRLPATASAEIEAATVNGRVSCDFEVAGGQSTRRKVEGRIGQGGARIDLAAVNGSVRIERGLAERAAARPPGEAPAVPNR